MLLIKNASEEKLRGGFYTPEPIVNFILRWAMNGNEKYDILEPSCGDGIFIRQIKDIGFKYHSITAVEIDKTEAEKTKRIDVPNKTVLNADFLSFCNSTKDNFDLAIGNPPYIRYQYFDKAQRKEAEEIFSKAGLKYSKLMNAWVSFVVGSCLLLKETGKLALVLPAEILQVSFAKQLRNFLARHFNKINIISFEKLVFPDIQQEIIILLCAKNGNDSHLIEHLELKNLDALESVDVMKLKSPKKKIDFKSNKWTFYFLAQEEIDFIEKLLHQKTILPLRSYANVEVGITTGSNDFFTVPSSVLKEYNLQKYAEPMVGRSVQVPSVIFTRKDWRDNIKNGAKAFFLKFPTLRELKNNKKALEYLKLGEEQKINKLYKLRIRDEWQIIPSAWVSKALFIRRNNLYPKLIINEVGAYTTDTMHRVTPNENTNLATKKEINIKSLVASYYNSLSFAFAEICGRSHGGGVLELMPNEVENILLPYDEGNEKLLDKIDSMMRKGKDIDEILAFTNETILKKNYNFSDKDIEIANRIWKKLSSRRLNRGKS